jgi:hypothetical protein
MSELKLLLTIGTLTISLEEVDNTPTVQGKLEYDSPKAGKT